MPVDAAHQEEQIRFAEELLFSGEKLPSFTKSIFMGICDSKRVIPFPRPSAEEEQNTERIINEIRRFSDDHLDPDWIDRNSEIPNEVIRGLGEIGVLGCTIPKEYGGLGMSQYAYCRMVEEVATRCGSTALFINAHQSIGLKALLLYGTEKQRAKFFKPLASGEMLAAFALTEPNAGSDAAGVETRAEFLPERNVYRINGQKQWITNGSTAGMLTVMAQTKIDGCDRITAFIVTPDMPGFKILEPSLEKVGMRGSITSNLAFEDVEVPAENILGEPGNGLKIALNCLNFGRTTFGAACTGSAKILYKKAVDHAINRIQFKRPLSSFGLVKEKIVRMGALVYAMDSSTCLTAGLLDRGEDDFMMETAILKVFSSEALWEILYDTMQILGGRSLFCDQPYERMMRDARLNMIGEGSNEVLRAFIGAVGIRDVGMQLMNVAQAARSPFSRLGTILGFGKKSITQLLTKPVLPVKSELLTAEARKYGSRVRRIGLAIPRVLAKHKDEIIERQLILNRLAECGIAMYTSAAVLSRIDYELSEKKGDRSTLMQDVALAKHYCYLAFKKIDQSLDGLFSNDDSRIEAVSDQITGWN